MDRTESDPGFFTGYIGTYTRPPLGSGKGIYAFRMNSKTGVIEDLRLAAQELNPSWLCLSPGGKYLYAASEVDDVPVEGSGVVSAYCVNKDGSLGLINRKPTGGKAPCHLALNGESGTGAESSYIVTANYSSGSLTVFPLAKDGALGDPCQRIRFSGRGPNPDRQEAPHAHSFMFDKKRAFGFALDLGTDRIMAYRFDPAAAEPLSPAEEPWYQSASGAGPRHGVFNADGTCAYSVNELDSTLDVLKYDPSRGCFERLQTLSCLPKGWKGDSACASVKIAPDGEFVYTSNRGHDSIAVFRIAPGGMAEWICAVPSGGRTPRDFGVAPDGNFVLAANQDSDNLAVFRVDKDSGFLKIEWEYPLQSPVCVVFS
ncbi:MAG: lactonase family protein [Treponema sp.]|jgi:6-phosphogluconolactonase|nr:lactonase family protein [Treponema sp.]